MTATRSRCWKAWRQCASALVCTSAPQAPGAFTTWCMRSWDNSIDEALAGFCDKIQVRPAARERGVCFRQRPWHPCGRAAQDRLARCDGGVHHPPRRRQVRRRQLQGFPAASTAWGASVVNALSTWLEVEVVSDGILYFQRFERGKAVTDLQNRGPAPGGPQPGHRGAVPGRSGDL